MCRLVTTSIDYLTTSNQPISEVSMDPFLPEGARRAVDLIEERRSKNGMVYLRYRAVEAT